MPAPAASPGGTGRTTTAEDFHTFAVEWDADGVRWFYDDELFYEVGPDAVGDREWVFDHPFFIILNLALGGTLGGNIALDLEFPIRYSSTTCAVSPTAVGEGAA